MAGLPRRGARTWALPRNNEGYRFSRLDNFRCRTRASGALATSVPQAASRAHLRSSCAPHRCKRAETCDASTSETHDSERARNACCRLSQRTQRSPSFSWTASPFLWPMHSSPPRVRRLCALLCGAFGSHTHLRHSHHNMPLRSTHVACRPHEAEHLLPLTALHVENVRVHFNAYAEEEVTVAALSDGLVAAIAARTHLNSLTLTDASLVVKRGALVDAFVSMKLTRLHLTNTCTCPVREPPLRAARLAPAQRATQPCGPSLTRVFLCVRRLGSRLPA